MMEKFQVNTWNSTNSYLKNKLLHIQTLIMFVYCFSICSCAATRHTAALENRPNTVTNLMEKRHNAGQQEVRKIFANRFYMIALSRTQSVLENGEIKYFSKGSGNLNVCGDTLISTIWDCTDTSIPVQKHENKIQNYTLTQKNDGKIEVSFRIEGPSPKRNKKTPVHYRLLASSPENITVFIDKTPYQGSLLPLY